jgi:curli production assembly/transport component CsgG
MKREIYFSTIKVLTTVLTVIMSFSGGDFFLSSAQAAEGYTAAVHNDLISLPPPRDKIVVAVYQLSDQSKQTASAASEFSATVALSATAMLNKTLEDSGWFIPIERQGLPSLLNEREIINSSGRQDRVETGEKLPPLLCAGVVLEGGVIASETDTVSAGLRNKYFDSQVPGSFLSRTGRFSDLFRLPGLFFPKRSILVFTSLSG